MKEADQGATRNNWRSSTRDVVLRSEHFPPYTPNTRHIGCQPSKIIGVRPRETSCFVHRSDVRTPSLRHLIRSRSTPQGRKQESIVGRRSRGLGETELMVERSHTSPLVQRPQKTSVLE